MNLLFIDCVFAAGLDLDPARAPAILAEACERAQALGRDF